jgi:hypothetical protein
MAHEMSTSADLTLTLSVSHHSVCSSGCLTLTMFVALPLSLSLCRSVCRSVSHSVCPATVATSLKTHNLSHAVCHSHCLPVDHTHCLSLCHSLTTTSGHLTRGGTSRGGWRGTSTHEGKGSNLQTQNVGQRTNKYKPAP